MYVVKKGDTLYSIAKQHGTTYQDIAKENGISNPNLIHPGQTLNIGGNSTSEAPAQQNNASAPAATGTAGGTPAPEQAQNNGFSYADYTPSDAVTQAQALLQQQMASKPGEYQSAWQGQLTDKISQILNRDKFSYDLNGDALYQQYADQYIQQGKMAMMDTMGQAQAMTGGYGNSYAQSVGQQAYQAHLQQLNDIVPELYGMALDQYNQEGQELYNQAALMAQQEDQDYGRYMDRMNAWLSERDFLTGRYDSERDYDYGKYSDNRDFSYGSFIDDRNYKYQQEQDALAEAWRQKEFDEAQRQYDEQMALTREQWDWEQKQASLTGGPGGNGGNGDNPGGGDTPASTLWYATGTYDDNGNPVFRNSEGKTQAFGPGINPYTGTKNKDAKNGTFSNGYQPNNINGTKLVNSGMSTSVTGKDQTIWKANGKYWLWRGDLNKYVEVDVGNQKSVREPAPKGSLIGGPKLYLAE